MTKQTINIGTTANDRSGDSLRTAFQKVNANFTELYTSLGLTDANLNLGAFEFNGSVMTTTDSSSITIDQATTVTSDLTVGGDILPSVNLNSTLGSPTNKFHSIYVGTGSVYLGDARLSLEGGKLSSSVGFDLTGSVGTVNGTVDWADVTSKPTIPTNTNELTNGAGFISSTNSLVNGVHNFTLASNGNLTFPDNLSYYNDGTLDTSIFQKSVTSETNDTVGSRVYLTYNEVGLEQYLDPDGVNNNQYGRVQVSGNGVRLEVSQELVGSTAYSRLDIAPTGMALSSTDGVSTNTYLFDGNTIVLPNDGIIQQRNSFTRTSDGVVSAATPTVVWTSAVDYISSAKLVIQVECNEVGDLTGWHSQACEAIISCRGYANVYGGSGGDPQMIVYGVVHTSVDALVTFTVQRNLTTRMVEVIGTPTAAANGSAAVKIHSIEMSTRD